MAGPWIVLARPEMRLYVAGQTCSLLGDATLWLALSVWVKELTASNSAAGAVIFAYMAPRLAAPVAGAMVDVLPVRRLLIGVNLATAAAVVPLVAVSGESQAWIIFAVAFAAGVSSTILATAQSRLLTLILPDELLPHGNALFQTIREGLRLVGPLAGAAVFAWLGGSVVALLDAAAFVAAAVLILRMREIVAPSVESFAWRGELSAGLSYVRTRPGLRRLILAGALAFAAFGLGEAAIFAVVDDGLGKEAPFVGVLLAFQGVGALAAGLVAPAALVRIGEAGACAAGMGTVACGIALMAVASVPVVSFGLVLFGAGLSWVVVGTATFVQRSTPTRLQGRVHAIVELSHALPLAIAIATGATLVAVTDYRVLLLGMVCLQLAAAAWLLLGRDLTPGRPPEQLARAGPETTARSRTTSRGWRAD